MQQRRTYHFETGHLESVRRLVLLRADVNCIRSDICRVPAARCCNGILRDEVHKLHALAGLDHRFLALAVQHSCYVGNLVPRVVGAPSAHELLFRMKPSLELLRARKR
jgi:hypothetical protein